MTTPSQATAALNQQLTKEIAKKEAAAGQQRVDERLQLARETAADNTRRSMAQIGVSQATGGEKRG